MDAVHFLGKILPEVVQISVLHRPPVTWKSSELSLTVEVVSHIENSQIDVECRLDRYLPEHFAHLYKVASDLSRVSVNLIAFGSGLGITVYLGAFVDPIGVRTTLLPQNESLPALCTAFSLTSNFAEEFDKLHSIALTESAIFMALNDLIVAINSHHTAPINCARAIEGMKNFIATPGVKRKSSVGANATNPPNRPTVSDVDYRYFYRPQTWKARLRSRRCNG